MILRGASGAHVCWRCRLCLSKPLVQAHYAFTAYSQRSQGFRQLHGGAPLPNEESSSPLTQKSESSQAKNGQADSLNLSGAVVRYIVGTTKRLPGSHKNLDDTTDPRGFFRRSSVHHPLGRLYGFHGRKLRAGAAELNVDSLGKPAEVIVLRDAGFQFMPPRQVEELEVTEKTDILAQLDAERGLIGQTDVENNIEEFKPKTNTITWDELQSIQRQLAAGFTVSQLVKYMEAFERRQKQGENRRGLESQGYSSGAILKKKRWVPGITKAGKEFDDSIFRGYRSEALTPKLRLVLLILRQCWQLEDQAITRSIGEVELEIRGTELELLILGHNSPLRQISNKLIASQDEKIEAFRSRGVIRVTAAKEKSDTIIQEIEEMLRAVCYLEVDLNALKPKLEGSLNETIYDDLMIDDLAQLTETHVTRLPNDLLQISCIDTKAQASLSTRADIARRLLLTSSNTWVRTKTELGCNCISGPVIAVKYHMTDDMSWRDRLRHWVRWTSAMPNSTVTYGEPENTSNQSVKAAGISYGVESHAPIASTASKPVSLGLYPREEIQSTSLSASKDPLEYGIWDKTTTDTRAIVGHLLQEVSATPEVTARFPEDIVSARTIFRPRVVNISRLLGEIPPLYTFSKTSLVMRFIPSPWTTEGLQMLTSLPPVEMLFKFDEDTKELKLKQVIAVGDVTASDIILPDRALDLRFQQRTISRLDMLQCDQLPQIAEFLKASQLSLARGRLETPPELTLPMTTYLCSGEAQERPNNSLNEVIDVHYIFGGLEYRNTLDFDFEGWRLSYTSVEGGKADGRRGELSLLPRRLNVDISEEGRLVWTEKFIEAAYHLVDILENSDTNAINFVKPFVKPAKTYRLPERNEAFRYFNRLVDFESREQDP